MNLRASLLLAAALLTPAIVTAATSRAGAAEIETVVVTAERRSEAVTDVPMAVSVLSGDRLSNLGVDNTKDLLQQIPGATLASSGPPFLSDTSMRGQGSGRNGFSETATGLFENGAYIAGGGFNGRSLTELNLFDLERVEVLHGPQGALYGRNAVGGAINVITNKPMDVLGFKAQAGYGSQNSFDLMGIVNVPIAEEYGIAARLGVFDNNQYDGFTRNLTTGNYIDKSRSVGGRFGITLEPLDGTKIYAQLEYYDPIQPSFGTLGYVPAHFAGTLLAAVPLDPSPYVHTNLNREGVARSPETTEYLAVDQASGIGDFSFNIYNRDRNAKRTNEDLDHFLALSGSAPGGKLMDTAQGQNEAFRLTDGLLTLSSNSTGRWKWLAGLEILQSRDGVVTGTEGCGAYIPGAQTAASLQPGCTPGFTGAPTDATALATARGAMNHDTSLEVLNSYALFGTLSYALTDDLIAGFEGRIAEDRKHYDFERYSLDPLAFWGTGAVPAGHAAAQAAEFCPPAVVAAGLCTAPGKGTFIATEAKEWQEFLPAATLNYKYAPGQSVYLRLATGYRPGGFNNPVPTTAPIAPPLIYKPEQTSSAEIGWKGTLFDDFVADTAIYYQATRDVQIVTYGGAGVGFIIQNPGDAFVYGIEANVSREFQIGPGSLAVSLGASSQYGRYYNTVIVQLSATTSGSINGDRIPRTRDIQGTLAGTYTVPLGSGFRLAVGGTVEFASGGFETPDNSRSYSGYDKLDLRASLMSDSGWSLALYGKNVFDQRYREQTVGSDEFWSQPATYGVNLTLQQ